MNEPTILREPYSQIEGPPGAIVLNRGRGAYQIQADGSWRRLDAAMEQQARAAHAAREEEKRAAQAAHHEAGVAVMRSAIAEMGGDPR